MKAKIVPALVTLSAGLIDCIISIYFHLDLFTYLKQLFVVLVIFFILGSVIQLVLEMGMVKMEKNEEELEEESESDENSEENELE